MNKLLNIIFLTVLVIKCSFAAEQSDNIETDLKTRFEWAIQTNQLSKLKSILNEKKLNINGNIIPATINVEKDEFGRWIRKYFDGVTPLIFATLRFQHPQIIKELIKEGADVNIGVQINDQIFYPLRIAYSNDDDGYTTLKNLFLITQEFAKEDLSSDHIEQAINYIDEFIAPKFSEDAARLRELLHRQ